MNLLHDIHIEILNSSHNRIFFDCGEEKLNTFLTKYANQNQNKNISKTYVTTNLKDIKNIVGFYTLSSGQINRENLPISKNWTWWFITF